MAGLGGKGGAAPAAGPPHTPEEMTQAMITMAGRITQLENLMTQAAGALGSAQTDAANAHAEGRAAVDRADAAIALLADMQAKMDKWQEKEQRKGLIDTRLLNKPSI